MEEPTRTRITPYQRKPLADSTLRGMSKDELIETLRDYEHNYSVLYEQYQNSVAAAEKLLKNKLDAGVVWEKAQVVADWLRKKNVGFSPSQFLEYHKRQIRYQIPCYEFKEAGGDGKE